MLNTMKIFEIRKKSYLKVVGAPSRGDCVLSSVSKDKVCTK